MTPTQWTIEVRQPGWVLWEWRIRNPGRYPTMDDEGITLTRSAAKHCANRRIKNLEEEETPWTTIQ